MADLVFDVEPIEYAVEKRSKRRALKTKRSEGFVQRRQVYEHPIRIITLRWRLATLGVMHDLDRLWQLSLGGVKRMTWTPLDGSPSFEVRFAGPKDMRTVQTGGVVYRLGCQLEEVL